MPSCRATIRASRSRWRMGRGRMPAALPSRTQVSASLSSASASRTSFSGGAVMAARMREALSAMTRAGCEVPMKARRPQAAGQGGALHLARQQQRHARRHGQVVERWRRARRGAGFVRQADDETGALAGLAGDGRCRRPWPRPGGGRWKGPRPVPPKRRVVVWSSWVKAEKIEPSFSGAMADAGIAHDQAPVAGSGSGSTWAMTKPVSVNFRAFRQQVATTCRGGRGRRARCAGLAGGRWRPVPGPFSRALA